MLHVCAACADAASVESLDIVEPPLSGDEAPVRGTAPASAGEAAPAEQRPSSKRPSSEHPNNRRLYSKIRFLWIHPRPDPKSAWIGYLSLGESVAIRKEDRPGSSDGCTRWYAIEPRGYACAGEHATLDADDPDVVELREHAAKRDEPYPYRFAESTGTTVYLNVPPRRRQYFRESGFNDHMAAIARVRAAGEGADVATIAPSLVGIDLSRSQGEPPTLLLHLGPKSRTTKTEVVRGSTVAYAHDFFADDRSWIMTWDRGIIAKDRVRPYRRSTFEGLPLNSADDLPIAFFRRASGDFARYARVAIRHEVIDVDGEPHWLTRDGRRVRVKDVAVARMSEAPLDGKWIDISITEGTLVAYEDARPIYATLISPGRGGLPVSGKTLLETASTPVGKYTVTGKFVTATMVSQSNDKIVHSEVPFTQNFSGPYALHAAYWHDDWGVGKSGGCVNLSARDAKFLFGWTDPPLPRDWHAVRFAGQGTTVWTHR